MKVRILTGESAGRVIDLPADFARRLILRGEVAEVHESSQDIHVVQYGYDTAALIADEVRKRIGS